MAAYTMRVDGGWFGPSVSLSGLSARAVLALYFGASPGTTFTNEDTGELATLEELEGQARLEEEEYERELEAELNRRG